MIRLCGAALCALAAALILRGAKSEFAGMVTLAAAVLFLTAAVERLAPVLRTLAVFAGETGFAPYLDTLTRALGITLTVQFSSELCRDAGEGALASKLELIGKAEILVLCLPLLEELVTLAKEVML